MTKNEYMGALREYLKDINVNEREELIADYQEHFDAGIESGRSEEEIADGLGDPMVLARQIKENAGYNSRSQRSYTKEKKVGKRGIIGKIFITLGLLFFNLVFVLGIVAGLSGVIIALWIVAISLIFAGGVGVIGSVMPDLVIISINMGSAVLISLGAIFLGVAMFIGMIYLSKGFIKVIMKYLRFNFRLIDNA